MPEKKRGVGKPRGTRNRFSKKNIEDAEARGKTPLEFMLDVMLNAEEDLKIRLDAAKHAAPYVHPKLAMTANVNLDARDTKELSTELLTEIVKQNISDGRGEGVTIETGSSRKLPEVH